METVERHDLKFQPACHFGDVMVVGGGISGIQAALDLATAGFKVYHEFKPRIIGFLCNW